MISLILVRHAKSSWDDPSLDDRDRPLNKRGTKDAPFIGKLMKKMNEFPDIIISSPARRAYDTARKIAEELNYSKDHIILDELLYMPSKLDFIKLSEKYTRNYKKIMMVSHNPGLTEFVNHVIDNYINNIPTCGVVRIDFHSDNINPESKGKMIYFEYPKKYHKKNG